MKILVVNSTGNVGKSFFGKRGALSAFARREGSL